MKLQKAALSEANPQSIKENTEYGGLVCKNKDGTYGYTKPEKGTGTRFDPSAVTVPPGTTVVGNYHTHGDYSVVGPDGNPQRTSDPTKDDYNSDKFSQADKREIKQMLLENLSIKAISVLLVALCGFTIQKPAQTKPFDQEKKMTETVSDYQQLNDLEPWALKMYRNECAKRRIDLIFYNAEYLANDNEYLVALYYKNKKPGLRGNDKEHPDYEVLMSRKVRKIVRVSLAR
jgi:hypothetical protein